MAKRTGHSPKVSGKRGLRFWLTLALLIHVEILAGIGIFAFFFAPRDADVKLGTLSGDEERIEVGVLQGEVAQRLREELADLEEEKRQEELAKEIEKLEAPGQVVEMAKPQIEERPKDARFAAEYDSRVAKQMKRSGELDPNAVSGRSAGQDRRTTPQVPAQPMQPALRGSAGQTNKPSNLLALRQPSLLKPLSDKARAAGGEDLSGAHAQSEGAIEPGEGDAASQVRRQPSLAPQNAGSGAPQFLPSAPGLPGLMPSEAQVARAIGSGTNDHLEEIEDGEETALNAKQWKFASFFNRVKTAVRSQWRPAEAYEKRDPTFKIYGERDRYTLLRVQLKPDGTLANVALETPSGLEFLDDEAIGAFKKAQPFPNPPMQLVQDGWINFKFGFYFEIGGMAPRFKVFRYNDF